MQQMKASALRSQFYFPSHSNLINPTVKTSLLNPSKFLTSFNGTRTRNYSRYSAARPSKTNCRNKPLILEQPPNIQTESKQEVLLNLQDGYSRFVILGAVSIGLAMFLAGMDDGQKALALGPEGPLVEEFWDNVRRYGLYILTVSTGAIYTLVQPIFELLKNPITAILIIVILGGSFYIVSQVVSAMVGVSEFAYEYAY